MFNSFSQGMIYIICFVYLSFIHINSQDINISEKNLIFSHD